MHIAGLPDRWREPFFDGWGLAGRQIDWTLGLRGRRLHKTVRCFIFSLGFCVMLDPANQVSLSNIDKE